MTTLDQAFIKAYGQDARTRKGGSSSVAGPSPRADVSTALPRPHSHFDVAEANRRALELSLGSAPQAEAFSPLKLFDGQPPQLSAAFEVEHFDWPEVCERLSASAEREFQQFSEVLAGQITRGRRMIAVTGCRRGEGRTTVTLCLGKQLAARGLRVAIVDADFRHPQLAEQLGIVPATGWDDVLGSELPLCEAMIESVGDRLTVVPLRAPLFDTDASLRNPKLGIPLRAIREVFDCVLLDCEPLAGPEAVEYVAVLAGRCGADAALLVHDLRHTSEEAYHHASKLLNQASLAGWDIVENFVP